MYQFVFRKLLYFIIIFKSGFPVVCICFVLFFQNISQLLYVLLANNASTSLPEVLMDMVFGRQFIASNTKRNFLHIHLVFVLGIHAFFFPFLCFCFLYLLRNHITACSTYISMLFVAIEIFPSHCSKKCTYILDQIE